MPVAAVLGISGEERRNVLAGACGAGWALPLFGVLSLLACEHTVREEFLTALVVLDGQSGSGYCSFWACERTLPIPRRLVLAGACGASWDASVVRGIVVR